MLDVHVDPDHNRSVLTYGGKPDLVIASCLGMVERAVAKLDLGSHEGVHPRFGIVDVIPFVRYEIDEQTLDDAAHRLGDLIVQRTGVPVYFYDRAAPEAPSLPLLRRMLRNDRTPGHPTAGVICLGVRDPLIAFNVNIRGTLDRAKHIASEVRKLPGVRALAFELASRRLVQVSMNLTKPVLTGPLNAFVHVDETDANIVDAEVAGLVPGEFLKEFSGLPMRKPVRSYEEALGR